MLIPVLNTCLGCIFTPSLVPNLVKNNAKKLQLIVVRFIYPPQLTIALKKLARKLIKLNEKDHKIETKIADDIHPGNIRLRLHKVLEELLRDGSYDDTKSFQLDIKIL